MDWIEFGASVIGSLAWPVTVITGAFLFRGPLERALDGRITRLAVAGVEVELGEIRGEVAQTAISALEIADEDAQILENLSAKAEILPIVALREGYRYLHGTLHERLDQPVDHLRTLGAIAHAAKRQAVLPVEAMPAIEGMEVLYELAERDDGRGLSITPDLATEFLSYLRAVLAAIRPR